MNVVVEKLGAAWAVWEETHAGGRRLLIVYRRKREAITVARFYARFITNMSRVPVEIIIKDRKGVIRQKDTAGYDSEKWRG